MSREMMLALKERAKARYQRQELELKLAAEARAAKSAEVTMSPFSPEGQKKEASSFHFF